MESCSVCCEPMTKRSVKCIYCDYITCFKCASKYLLDVTIHTKCMSCSKAFSRRNMIDMFGDYFVSHNLKKRRENILFGLETAMLPASQEKAAVVMKIRDIDRIALQYEAELMQIDIDMRAIHDDYSDECYAERKRMYLLAALKKFDIMILKEKKNRLRVVLMGNRARHNTPNTVTIKCPGEGCRGFISCSGTGSCDLCTISICKKCHEQVPVDSSHTCSPETLASVQLIMKDTKCCPKCKSLIHKINGCDQMFCTMCHTAFSWRTGETVHGDRIHNPHYYEYLRQTNRAPREIEDIPCGGLPGYREVLNKAAHHELARICATIHRLCAHIEGVEIPRYRTGNENNEDIRIKYLTGDIPLDNFKREVYKREKARDKKREIQEVLVTFVTVGADLFRSDDYTDVHSNFETIRNITNDANREISLAYKCVVPLIKADWTFISNWKAF